MVKFGDSFWNSMWCMILTMTTVGYGEVYPVTVMGRIFTIIACIWGSFCMSMVIVTLTGVIQFSPEEETSYNEINNVDQETIKKAREEAAIVIQAAWRYVMSKGDVKRHIPPANFQTRLRTRLEFVAIVKRSKYKRLNITNANPQLGTIINELEVKVNGFLEKGMKNLSLYKNSIAKQVGEIRQNQYMMDAKILKMYDVTMRLNSFVIAANKGEDIEGAQFNKNKQLYNHKGQLMPRNAVKELLALFKDARRPADSFYESYRVPDKEKGGQSPANMGTDLKANSGAT